MILRDKWGWPVERIKGRPIQNFIRDLLHVSLWKTWKMRKEPWPKTEPSDDVQQGPES